MEGNLTAVMNSTSTTFDVVIQPFNDAIYNNQNILVKLTGQPLAVKIRYPVRSKNDPGQR